MKIFAVFIFILTIAASQHSDGLDYDIPNKQQIHDSCQKNPATRIESGMAKEMKDGECVDDPKFKAHVVCMMKGAGWLDANGNLIKDVIIDYWNKHFDGAISAKLKKYCLVQYEKPEDNACNIIKCQYDIVNGTS